MSNKALAVCCFTTCCVYVSSQQCGEKVGEGGGISAREKGVSARRESDTDIQQCRIDIF